MRHHGGVPELPEVETIRAQLAERLVGRRIVDLTASWSKSLEHRGVTPGVVEGRSIVAARRRGKVLILDLENSVSLLVHLRMTGQLILDEPGIPVPPGPTRVIAELDHGRLRFCDQRKFGRVVAVRTDEVDLDPLLARMGPEPLNAVFDGAVLWEGLRHHRGLMIKPAILDQSVVAGVGNIYADESLWHAKLHPERRCGGLTKAEVERVAMGIVIVLAKGIEAGGSTMRDYVDANGERGGYLDEAVAFGRTGLACRRCGALIIKTRVAGRGTHVCPICQPTPSRKRSRRSLSR